MDKTQANTTAKKPAAKVTTANPVTATTAKNANKRHCFGVLMLLMLVLLLAAAIIFYLDKHTKTSAANNTYQSNMNAKLTSDNALLVKKVVTLSAVVTDNQQQIAGLNQKLEFLKEVKYGDNSLWTVAYVIQLLKVANLNLQFDRDPEQALHNLVIAKKELQALNKPQFIPLAKAIDTNILQIKMLPKLNKTALIVKLSSINAALTELTFNSPNKPISEKTITKSKKSFKEAWLDSLETIKSLIVIRHLDKPITPMLSSEQQSNVILLLQGMLTQAEWAVAHQQQEIFKVSLTQLKNYLEQYFVLDNSAAHAILTEVNNLLGLPWPETFPDLNNTINIANGLFVTVPQAVKVPQSEQQQPKHTLTQQPN